MQEKFLTRYDKGMAIAKDSLISLPDKLNQGGATLTGMALAATKGTLINYLTTNKYL